jgi:RIO-like serine/threonine protein kinase
MGRKNNPSRTNAIGVCCVLIKKYCKISQSEIGRILRKDVSNVNKYIKKCQNLDSNFKSDKDILISIKKIEDRVHIELAQKLI